MLEQILNEYDLEISIAIALFVLAILLHSIGEARQVLKERKEREEKAAKDERPEWVKEVDELLYSVLH